MTKQLESSTVIQYTMDRTLSRNRNSANSHCSQLLQTEHYKFVNLLQSTLYQERAARLLGKFDIKDTKEIVVRNLSDLEISHLIQQKIVQQCKLALQHSHDPPRDNPGRDRSLANTALRLLPHGFRPARYVDIGCGDGKITDLIGRGLRCPDVIGFDVFDTDTKDKKNIDGFVAPINFPRGIKYRQLQNDCLDIATASVDFVTINMAFHHFQNPHAIVAEVKRIMRKDAILYMREHHTVTKEDGWLVDFEHCFYEITADCDVDAIFNRDRGIQHRSQMELVKIFTDIGFRVIHRDNRFTPPTNRFAVVFRKK